jgi:hypothetical protein
VSALVLTTLRFTFQRLHRSSQLVHRTVRLRNGFAIDCCGCLSTMISANTSRTRSLLRLRILGSVAPARQLVCSHLARVRDHS